MLVINGRTMKYICGLVVTFLISCTTQTKLPFEEFDLRPIEIEFVDEFIPNFELNNPFRLIAYDSVIIMHDRIMINDETYFLRVVDSQKGNSIRVFGREGRGPQEFLFPIELSRTPGREHVLTANNRSMFEIKLIQLDSLIAGSEEIVSSIYRNFNVGFSRIQSIGTSGYIGTGFFGNNRYAIADTTGSINMLWGDYPFPASPKATPESQPMAYQSRMVVHSSGSLVASVTIKSPNFELFSIDGDSIIYVKRINYRPVSIKDESGSGIISVQYLDDNVNGFSSIDANDFFIYTLFSGKLETDMYDSHSDTVILFDWDGNPVYKIILPVQASQISVTPSNEYIYTLSYDSSGTPMMNKFMIINF